LFYQPNKPEFGLIGTSGAILPPEMDMCGAMCGPGAGLRVFRLKEQKIRQD